MLKIVALHMNIKEPLKFNIVYKSWFIQRSEITWEWIRHYVSPWVVVWAETLQAWKAYLYLE